MRSSLSPYLAEEISSAELLEEVRERAKVGMILWPNVRERIFSLQCGDTCMSDLEIRRAIDSGCITKPNPRRVKKPANCWVITLIGIDSEGEKLGVILHLPMRRSEPLEVTEIFLFEPGFQLGLVDELS